MESTTDNSKNSVNTGRKTIVKIVGILIVIFFIIRIPPLVWIVRPSPQRAMEKYLEFRHFCGFTLVEGSESMSTKNYLEFNPYKQTWHADYKCKKIDYYRVKAECSLKAGGLSYKCSDDYDLVKKKSEFRQNMLEIVPELVGDKCYVWVEQDSANSTDYPFFIYIYVKSISEAKARAVAEKLIEINADKGIYCTVGVAEYSWNEEIFCKIMTEDPGDFSPFDPMWEKQIIKISAAGSIN